MIAVYTLATASFVMGFILGALVVGVLGPKPPKKDYEPMEYEQPSDSRWGTHEAQEDRK